ncbi:MAG: NAD(P)(+) transhydrogenase (Re/Si-specific) subunit beta, partial [Bacteroidota bacterium]
MINLAYLLAASLFILGIKRLSSPATARSGNQMAAAGMLVAVVATLFAQQILTPAEMIGGLVVGGAIGVLLAKRIEMTSMPELVAAFNGFGGASSAFVASAEVARALGGQSFVETDMAMVAAAAQPSSAALSIGVLISISLSVLIGTITFSGSFVAFGKLSGRLSGNPTNFPGMRLLTVVLILGAIGAATWMVMGSPELAADANAIVVGCAVLVGIACLLGILLVIPIGGADMTVGVALLTSDSGLAAA